LQLWDNEALRTKVLSTYCPKVLLDLAGLDNVIQRVPINYLKAIFSAFLASRFVYTYGLDTSPFAFYEYVNTQMN
jgi:glutamate dehydrogenase